MRWFVFDTETTGLGPEARPCEVAWLEIDEVGSDLHIVNSVQSLIDPEIPISFSAQGVHGITPEDVADAPTLPQFFDIVLGGELQQEDVGVIGHKVAFDVPFLKPYVGNIAAEICTLRLGRRVWPEAEDHQLQTLRCMLGVKPDSTEGAHRALYDVQATLGVLRHLAMETGMGLEELAALNTLPVPITKMPMGKHKGVPLAEVPKQYIRWLLSQPDVDPDLRAALEAL